MIFMTKNNRFFSFLTLLSTLLLNAFLMSCGTETTESNINNPCLPAIDISKVSSEINVKIERVDNEIFALKTKEEISAYFKKNQLFTKKYIQLERFGGNDSIPVKEIYSLISNKFLDTLHQDCNRIYGDMKPLENALSDAFRRIKAVYPDFVPPRVQTMITGYGKGVRLREMPDMLVSKELIVIGLEFFLGSKYKYQPDVPEYIARRYTRENIVPMIIREISTAYNKYDEKDRTMLGETVFYGKTYYFMQSVLPCMADSMALGYTNQQMKMAYYNRQTIWKHYIDKQIFFNAKNNVVKDYMDESPFTLPISQECPGAIGRWSGLRMVRAYMQKNPKITLLELLNNDNAKNILENSGYKGE